MAADPARSRRAPLGANYWKLFSASLVSNLGDGIDSAALPLVAAALTRDPLLFSGVAVAGRIPWLLFALQAGALADRVDRRWMMGSVNVGRFVLMGILGVAILGDWASIWLLYAITFLLGTAEVLFDTSSQAILPRVVTNRNQLERANGLLFGSEIVANQFVGPPLGGFLFAIAASLPILLDAGTFAISAGLIFALTGNYATRRASDGAPTTTIRADIREGLSWLWNHRLLRTLALLLGTMNGLNMMAFAIGALYALEVLDLDEVGFGVLLAAGATGSVLGSMVAGRLVDKVGRGRALWLGLVVSAAVPIGQGLTSNAFVFGALAATFGFSAVVWNVITVSLRQTVIPDDKLGRVNAVYRFIGWGSMPIGALLGGLVADVLGLRAPFFIAGGGMLLTLLPASRVITTSALEQARSGAAGGPEAD
ncbi:MAG: MFS transporter [Nitriliruptorales bacterium]|nr:MFS transporter [Nitriliruptorales bacterium]